MTNKKCIIFTGGESIYTAGFEKEYFENSYIIVADSGCAQLEALASKDIALSPNVLLGDMDSYEKVAAVEHYPDAEVLSFPPEKDYTDTQLAVEVASGRGFSDIEIIGGTGGRADHFLANLALLRRYAEKGVHLVICDGKNRISYFRGGKVELSKSDNYKYFSLLPDGTELLGVSIIGAKYELCTAFVDRDLPITVSNEITADKCSIEINAGHCFIMQCSD